MATEPYTEFYRPGCPGCRGLPVLGEGLVVQGYILHLEGGGLIGRYMDCDTVLKDVPPSVFCRKCFEEAVGWGSSQDRELVEMWHDADLDSPAGTERFLRQMSEYMKRRGRDVPVRFDIDLEEGM